MKRALAAIGTLSLMALVAAQSTEDLVLSYQRNFVRSSLSIKLDLLKEAAVNEAADMSPLYLMSIDFCLENAILLQNDVQLRELAVYSIARLHKAKQSAAAAKLWALFQVFRDAYVRVPLLSALADLASGNAQIILNLNSFLFNQNTIKQAGVEPDIATVEACVTALGKLESGTSYPVLFAVYSSGYPESLTKRAAEALSLLKGDYKGYLIEVIRKNPPIDKASALRAAMENPRFTEADKAEVAEASLDMSLGFSSEISGEAGLNREIRYRAVRELTQRSWSRASELAVRNFTMAYREFSSGEGSKAAILEAIACLEAMKTTEAAQTLTLHLQLLNAETDGGKTADEQIAMAVIHNLGLLGDKAAFDHLLFVSYLPYSESIKGAARDALKKLKL